MAGQSLTPAPGLENRFAVMVEAVGGREKAAQICGRTKMSIRRYESGENEPPFDVVARLAVAAGRSLDWVASGAAHPADVGGFVLVPKFEVQASAGGGFDNGGVGHGPSEMIAFREDWLRSLGVNPAYAQALMARGDSMEPTIRDGDLLLVDRFIHRVIDEGIYVVTVAGLVVVKRLQMRRDGTLVLMSDNRRYTDEVVPPHELDTIVIEGRVRWIARTT